MIATDSGAGTRTNDAHSFDLDAYLHRIGYQADRTADLTTLGAIVQAHSRQIAFENLDPFLRRPVGLDVASLQAKLVHGGRGGYCFEQNLLLTHALRSLDYETTGLAARVLWNQPAGAPLPASGHMLVRVELAEGSHLVDVGFGGFTLTGVLKLEPNVIQPTPHGSFRLIPQGDDFIMEAKARDAWQVLYRFGLAEAFQSDYEVSSWYLYNHPESHFVTGLMAARSERGCRYGLSDNRLRVHHLDGDSDHRLLHSPQELMAALEDDFLLDLSGLGDIEAALARLW